MRTPLAVAGRAYVLAEGRPAATLLAEPHLRRAYVGDA